MSHDELNRLLRAGIAAAEKGNTMMALVHLENAERLGSSPMLASYLGYCLAVEKRQIRRATALCQQAMQDEPGQSLHYLNLGRVYLAAGQKPLALKTLRQGLKRGNSRLIVDEIKRLGVRKQPPLPGLDRSHPLNRFLGKILYRIGLR